MKADQGKYARRLDEEIRSTIIWLGVSVLFVITGIEEVYQHHNSGWLLAATPLLVLAGYFVRRHFILRKLKKERPNSSISLP
jgi:hypothetical protein